MKFKVESLSLVNMLKNAIKGYASRDDSSFVYLKIDEETNELKVVSRSQAGYFSGKIEITNLEIDNEAEPTLYYVDGEVLKKLTSIFPSAPIQIEFSCNQDSRVFVAKYTGNKLKLPVISDSNEIPMPELTEIGMIQGTEFMFSLNSLLKIVDNDQSAAEHASSCLHLKFENDTMYAMATDRFALAELETNFTPKENSSSIKTILIKSQQANLLSKTVAPAEVLQLVYSNEYFGYIDGFGNVALVGQADITPLVYQQIKNATGNDFFVEVETSELKDALSTISKLAFEDNFVLIEFDQKNKECKVSSVAGDVITIPVVNSQGDNSVTVTFTRSVLEEALNPVHTDNVKIEWPNAEDVVIYKLTPFENNAPQENIFIGVTCVRKVENE